MTCHLFTLSAIALLFTGCANSGSEPSFGHQLGARSDKTNTLSKQWVKATADVNKGQSMIKRGNNLVEDGQKKEKKGQRMIEEGQQLVENGKKQITDAEAEYRAMAANPIPTTTKSTQ